MNIEHLKTFREIARVKNFSEAAKKLHVTQPAVTFQIQKLEQELGVQLIDRSQRTVELTEAGKRLLRFAEAVEEEREKLRRDLDQMREEISGSLYIGASTIPGEYILPPLLAKFKRLHPAVMVQVEVMDSLTVVEKVRENDFDIGFCGSVPEGKDLEYFKIAEDEIVLIVPADHPLAAKREAQPDDLEGEPFIFREAASGTQRSLENWLNKAGISSRKLTPHLVLGSTQAVISAVAAGAGIAFISNIVLKEGSPESFKQVKVRGLRFSRDFYCVFRKDKVLNRLNNEFKEFIHTETATHD